MHSPTSSAIFDDAAIRSQQTGFCPGVSLTGLEHPAVSSARRFGPHRVPVRFIHVRGAVFGQSTILLGRHGIPQAVLFILVLRGHAGRSRVRGDVQVARYEPSI